MKPLVYILLVNYNGYEDTIECIRSLEKISYDNYQIVVIDNASTDASVERLRAACPTHVLLESERNLGFSAGNNIGIRYALAHAAEYVLLLNNDTVVEPDFLDRLMEGFQPSEQLEENAYAPMAKVGIAGGKHLFYDQRNLIAHAGGSIDLFRFVTVHYGIGAVRSAEQFNQKKAVGFLSGCMMLIEVQLFEKTGLLDEQFFMYYEDTDFCMKALEHGYRLVYCPEAEIYHKGSKSSGGEDSPFFLRWNTRNRLVFMDRYKKKSNFVKYAMSVCYVYLTRLLRIVLYLSHGEQTKAKSIITGLLEGRDAIKANGVAANSARK